MAVVQNEETGKFDFICELEGCGNAEAPFMSTGWDLKKQAKARGDEHIDEHVTGKPMTELVAFEKSIGFIRDNNTEGANS